MIYLRLPNAKQLKFTNRFFTLKISKTINRLHKYKTNTNFSFNRYENGYCEGLIRIGKFSIILNNLKLSKNKPFFKSFNL